MVASVSVVTKLFFNKTSKDGANVLDYLLKSDDSTSNIHSFIEIKSNTNGDSSYAIYEVTAATAGSDFVPSPPVANQMAVLTVQNGVGTLPSSGEDVVINVLRTGDKGQKGVDGTGADGIKGDKGCLLYTSDAADE